MSVVDMLQSNGTLASWGEGPGGYYGQTFVADGAALAELQFIFASNSGNTDYRVYITSWTGSGPGTILWQSALLQVGTLATPTSVTVAIPNIGLTVGTKYAFILDTSVGLLSGSSAGSLAARDPFSVGYPGNYAGGEFFFNPFETGTVAGNLALAPFVLDSFDLAFRLTFGDVANSPPVANDDTASVSEDSSVVGNVLANDSDLDAGDSITVTGISFDATSGTIGAPIQGLYGTLTLHADGSYSYAADSDLLDTLSDASGLMDVFTYEISDAAGQTASASLTVNVSLVNDARTTIGTNRPDIIFGDRDGLVGAEDTIFGGNANDQLFGLAGADVLHGEQGNDRLSGGEGPDRFVFSKSGGDDIVTDFEHGLDHVVLNGITLKSIGMVDLDDNDIADAVLRFSSGSATLMNVGDIDVTSDIISVSSSPSGALSGHAGNIAMGDLASGGAFVHPPPDMIFGF